MSKVAAIIIVVLLFLFLLGYGIFLFEMYRHNKWIFAPYRAPPKPDNAFYPLGPPDQKQELTVEENVEKNNRIAETLKTMCSDGTLDSRGQQCQGISKTISRLCNNGQIGREGCNAWGFSTIS